MEDVVINDEKVLECLESICRYYKKNKQIISDFLITLKDIGI